MERFMGWRAGLKPVPVEKVASLRRHHEVADAERGDVVKEMRSLGGFRLQLRGSGLDDGSHR